MKVNKKRLLKIHRRLRDLYPKDQVWQKYKTKYNNKTPYHIPPVTRPLLLYQLAGKPVKLRDEDLSVGMYMYIVNYKQ